MVKLIGFIGSLSRSFYIASRGISHNNGEGNALFFKIGDNLYGHVIDNRLLLWDSKVNKWNEIPFMPLPGYSNEVYPPGEWVNEREYRLIGTEITLVR